MFSPAKLQSVIEDEDFMLVNTHVPFEGNLPRTGVSVAYNEIGQGLETGYPRIRTRGSWFTARVGA